ncbi:MAG: hypothetical protein EHJ94_00315 [Deltaproteobacteria bacterium]|nr:MAG: hypothetical protein EHJ94_00315 [Deltaproteobacteria bacterium]
MTSDQTKNTSIQIFSIGFFILLLLCLIFSAKSAQAKNENPPGKPSEKQANNNDLEKQYLTLFRKLFFSETYNSLKCYENIYSLLNKASADGLDVTDVKVIFIFDKDHDKLVPSNTSKKIDFSIQRPNITMYKTRIVYNRSAPPGEFRFHAFAAFQDKIMDFDYTNSPKLIPAREYFESMFSNKKINRKERNDLFSRLTLRVIPAKDFLNNGLRHTSWYLFDLETNFPSQTLQHFLSNLEAPQSKKQSAENNP